MNDSLVSSSLCLKCNREIEFGEGRYQLTQGLICTDCYSPSVYYWIKQKEQEGTQDTCEDGGLNE